MKKGNLLLRHKYGQNRTDDLWIPQALAFPSRRETYRNKPIVPERAHNLITLLSQTCAYAHEIAFTWCNTRDIHVGARLNTCDTAVHTCMME